MEFKEIQELIRLINKTDIAEVKIKNGDFDITIRSNACYTPDTTVANVLPSYPSAVPTVIPSPIMPAANVVVAETSANVEKPATPKESTPATDENYITIKSPMIGTFYRSPGPEKPSFVKVGDTINKGDVVCIIEAMKLFNEIEAEVSGTIVKVLVDDASPIEYDQAIFLVKP
ncbi:MAG: acetyl-CoA carboxylase biotin carboxyl carrier protein [Chitinophagales bacterium]|nr:acetyl-CoA carboxylase biotin carboxyl carrier protein [Bacteroidota bacterium]MCB9042359.1 acetyl-CoA carboxylase biotin carboxyl carrier protein [Chitinophagales bacterium]